jgi:hypothetical protein
LIEFLQAEDERLLLPGTLPLRQASADDASAVDAWIGAPGYTQLISQLNSQGTSTALLSPSPGQVASALQSIANYVLGDIAGEVAVAQACDMLTPTSTLTSTPTGDQSQDNQDTSTETNEATPPEDTP